MLSYIQKACLVILYLIIYLEIKVAVTILRYESAGTVVCISEVLFFYCHSLFYTVIAVGLLV